MPACTPKTSRLMNCAYPTGKPSPPHYSEVFSIITRNNILRSNVRLLLAYKARSSERVSAGNDENWKHLRLSSRRDAGEVLLCALLVDFDDESSDEGFEDQLTRIKRAPG